LVGHVHLWAIQIKGDGVFVRNALFVVAVACHCLGGLGENQEVKVAHYPKKGELAPLAPTKQMLSF